MIMKIIINKIYLLCNMKGILLMNNVKGPRFKLCRRLGLNVVGHPKAMNRATPQNSRAGRKMSTHGEQLLEKQRLRAYYGVKEKQFVRYVAKAKRSKSMTGEALVTMLECRLDNLVYRMGFAKSLRQARQMVVHGHIRINGNKVDRPSYSVTPGEVISLSDKARDMVIFKENYEEQLLNSYPYIEKGNDLSATLIALPERSQVPVEIQDHLVVEYYARR